MAEDKGKKKVKPKKDKPEPRNWKKIGLQLFILLVLVMAVIGFTLNVNHGKPEDDSAPATGKSFNDIADGLKLIPANASHARYADLKNDSVLAASAQRYLWLYGTLPSEKVFGARPQRDLFAVYPGGHFSDFAEQFISLTDFGTARINQSYPDYYDIEGVIAKMISPKNFYTGATRPVVSGRIENVAPTIDVMLGNNASAYANYSAVFEKMRWKQIPTDYMTLETVGRSCNLSYTGGYYAAIGPVDRGNTSPQRLYNYTAVMLLNGTMPEDDRLGLALLEEAMEKKGFSYYRTQVYDDCIIIEAQGSFDYCVDDMLNRWGFIKYQASL